MCLDEVQSKSGEEKTVAKGPKARLVKLAIIANATQNKVTGAKNWATVKKAATDVIVEATTTPSTADAWKKIKWSGDSGTEVPGKPNQRRLSRAVSKKLHVEAELGGVKDFVDVWVLWATVTILTTGTTPANAVQNGPALDGTEKLGARYYNGKKAAAGKVIPVAKIEPAGIHDVVQSGWKFKRQRWTHDWNDGIKDKEGNSENDYWNTTWVNDDSEPSWMKLVPDNDDKIYDNDAPNIEAFGVNDCETYNNFKQWVEWDGTRCSRNVNWNWQGRWKKSELPQVTFKDVGTGVIDLPDKSHFHP